MRKKIIEDFVRAIATFGFVASFTAAAYIILGRQSVTSDDPYLIGVITSSIVSLSLLISLLCERIWTKRVGVFIYAGIYLSILVYVIYIVNTAELFGPGMAIIIFGQCVLWALVELALLRKISLVIYGSIGSVLTIALIGGFIAVHR